jgi:hypothetical protein
MARKTEQAALSVPPPAAEEGIASLAMLDQYDFEVSGLEEVDSEDIRFAYKVWNLKGKRADGPGLYQIDEFLDTLTEQTSRELQCVLVTLHKTQDYSYFNNDAKETVRVCSSYDRVEGTLRTTHPVSGQPEGTVRRCETCPDRQWRRDAKGKNIKNCATVYGVVGVELDASGQTLSPFMIRFKRTSLQPFKAHLQKHHIKRHRDARTGKMIDVPLFMFAVKVRLDADEGGQFAVPVIEPQGFVSQALLFHLAEQAKLFHEMSADLVRGAEKKESAHSADGESGSNQPLRGDDFAD